MSKNKSEFDGIMVTEGWRGFRLEEHRIINDSVFNVKHIDISMDEAIQMIKDLQKSIRRRKKVDIESFGYIYSLKSEREKHTNE